MANRFPLVVDTDDGNKLKEIPEGDQLDLSNSGIANLTSLSVAGALSGSTLSTTGNVSIGGTLNVTGVTTVGTIAATAITLGGETVGVPVQSNWEETNNTSLAFIRNKPDLSNLTPATLGSIGDVFVDDAVANDVLTWDGFSWQAEAAQGGGVDLTAFTVVDNPPSGIGSLVYDNTTGIFTYTPPNALRPGDNISELNNDSNYTTLSGVEGAGYIQTGDVVGFGRITSTVVGGQVQLTFSETGLLTVESDTLATVVARGASTNDQIEADAFNQLATSTSTNTLKDVSIETLTILTSITGTNSNISTTNGNITATNGTVTGNNGSFSNQLDGGGLTIAANTISSTTGNISVNAAAKVIFSDGGFNLLSTTLPGSPTQGDMYYSNNALYLYVNDDGSGSAGWVNIGGPGAGTGGNGMALPVYEDTDFPTGQEGQLLYDLTNSVVKVFNGTSWTNV
jgi:hypothetical protein